MFVQTVQTKAEAPLSIKCLTKSTVPGSFMPPDVVRTGVTIWTGGTLSAPLANNQAISKFELHVPTDYEMLY